VQDEISGAVVDALKVQLLSSRPLTSRHQTDNTEAYSQYLLGNQLRLRDTPESNEQARTTRSCWRHSARCLRRSRRCVRSSRGIPCPVRLGTFSRGC
jgi:hypothetical protein